MKFPLDKTDRMAEQCAARGMRRAERALAQLFDEALRPCGLRATQLTLLTTIRRTGPVAVKPLADAMGMDRTTLARNLKPLERDGLLEVAPDPADRRVKQITLTAAGHQRLAQAFPLWERAQSTVRDRLGASRARDLVKELAAVADLFWPAR